MGRETKDIDEEKLLLLDPTYNQLDKKIPGFVDFAKLLERKEKDQIETEELVLNPVHNYVDPKIKGNADFGKIVSREDDPINKINVRSEECIINPKEDLIKPHTANFVQMDKGGERFIKAIKKNEDIQENKNPPSDVLQAFEAIKPEKNMMKFEGYSGREKTKIKIRKKPSSLFVERGNKKE